MGLELQLPTRKAEKTQPGNQFICQAVPGRGRQYRSVTLVSQQEGGWSGLGEGRRIMDNRFASLYYKDLMGRGSLSSCSTAMVKKPQNINLMYLMNWQCRKSSQYYRKKIHKETGPESSYENVIWIRQRRWPSDLADDCGPGHLEFLPTINGWQADTVLATIQGKYYGPGTASCYQGMSTIKDSRTALPEKLKHSWNSWEGCIKCICLHPFIWSLEKVPWRASGKSNLNQNIKTIIPRNC